jgi:ankyrin repeat protein
VFSPIHCAAINDNDTCAELLLDTLGSNILELTDKKGRTPLHTAVYGNHLDCVQFFLNHKANIECRDITGQTPLLIGASMGHTRVLGMLIQENADVHAVDEEGNTALHLACSKGHSDCGLALVRQMSDECLSAQNLDGRT